MEIWTKENKDKERKKEKKPYKQKIISVFLYWIGTYLHFRGYPYYYCYFIININIKYYYYYTDFSTKRQVL